MEIPFSELAALDGIDYCIIGAGPAGITCARELASKGRRILLIEGGDREWSLDSQSLYEGETIGDKYFDLDACRLRYFGGTSNHWTGWCRPLDALDFEGKGPDKTGAWPIRRSDLDGFFDRAAEILEIEAPAPDMALPGGTLRRIFISFSPPVRFAEKYWDEIAGSQRIILALNCNLTGMSVTGGAVSGITVQNHEGARADIKARTFILACGGMENSRLLQWCNVTANGALLGPRSDLVGRYWFEHHYTKVGEAILETGFVERPPDARSALKSSQMFFSLTPAMIAEAGTLSCGLRLLPSGGGTARALIEDIACVAPNWANWAYDALVDGSLCAHTMKATAEQEPRFENRVALGPVKDRFGIPKTQLQWRHSALDLRTLQEAAKALGFYLAAQDVGRARLEPWVLGEGDYPADETVAAYHHMGGTRMSDDPATGVVDRDCKLFGMANLYVIGSSVFPSGGHGTPTITVTQLALRLSDHLAAAEAVDAGVDPGVVPEEAPLQQ
jgi:choline dehydrogenase-like flavoprotein